MNKLLVSKTRTRDTAKVAKQVDNKKLLIVALSTFLVLVVVSEGLRLALLSW